MRQRCRTDARARRLTRAFAGVAAAWIAGVTGCGDAQPEQVDDPETRARMVEIFEAMRVLLPAAADPEELGDPRNRPWVGDALDALSRNAFALSQHGAAAGDLGFRMLGSSLARDASDARRFHEEGRPEAAAFLILQTTDHCVSCHSKLPSPGDSPRAQDFVESSTLATLPLDQRASLQVATRRFDAALDSYETLLASPDQHPAQLFQAVSDYLTICIRVKGDFERPVPTLEAFAQRPDLWRNLRSEVESWVDDLPDLADVHAAPPELETARALMREAQSRLRFPDDRRALVHYITASSILQRVVQERVADGRGQSPELAEAYYLLGLADSHVGNDTWVSETPSYLEAAIRLSPQGPYAERAYALLEEEVILGYTGSAGTRIPPDVDARLRELRELMGAL